MRSEPLSIVLPFQNFRMDGVFKNIFTCHVFGGFFFAHTVTPTSWVQSEEGNKELHRKCKDISKNWVRNIREDLILDRTQGKVMGDLDLHTWYKKNGGC